MGGTTHDPMGFDEAIRPSWAVGTEAPRRPGAIRPSMWRFDASRNPLTFPGNRRTDCGEPAAASVLPKPVPGDAPGAGATRRLGVLSATFWTGVVVGVAGAGLMVRAAVVALFVTGTSSNAEYATLAIGLVGFVVCLVGCVMVGSVSCVDPE